MNPGVAKPVAAGLAVLAVAAIATATDAAYGWVEPGFQAFTRLFQEVSTIAQLRAPSQVPLFRLHGLAALILAGAGLLASPWTDRHGRRWLAVFLVGYAVRAGFWIGGGNLPLVPGDSSHYVEVATSVDRGEGAVKHYVESYFRDYPAIRAGRGVLDDWATPLWAYLLAGCYRVAGVDPGADYTGAFAVAKGASFTLSLLALPTLYGFARRGFGREVGLLAMAALAILPAHALYAGMALRESLVALLGLGSTWAFVEMATANPGRGTYGYAVIAGLAGGLSALARNTSLALLAAFGLAGLAGRDTRRPGPMVVWGLVSALVAAPWAWATWREYGEPFYTYTKYFAYNFSWTVHHYDRGNLSPGEFYNAENLPGIVEAKVKAFGIVLVYTPMILSLPLAAGFLAGLRGRGKEVGTRGRVIVRIGALTFVVFLIATLVNIADVTQVRQLARYYLPVYLIMLPTAVFGLVDSTRRSVRQRARPTVAAVVVALLWADPSWAYDASWYSKPFQERLPAIIEAGEWVAANPELVQPESRIMTWFPWEFRVASGRTTILFPRALEAGDYELTRLREVIRKYGVTHILWGSFEPMPGSDPETLGPYLEWLRLALGLTEDRLLHRSPTGLPHPLRLYRLTRGTAP